MTVMIRTHDSVGRGLGAESVRVEVDIVDVGEEVMGVGDRLVDELEEGGGVDGPGDKDGATAAGAKRTVWLDDEVVDKGGSPAALGYCKSLRE